MASSIERSFTLTKKLSFLLISIISGTVFFLTAYRSITWWDSAEYILAAATLGVAHPPGSLLLTLIGWPFTLLLPDQMIAFGLNLLAALFAVLMVGSTALLSIRISKSKSGSQNHNLALLGTVLLTSLTLAFGPPVWRYAIKFTPYILTPLFTVLIVAVMFRIYEFRDRQIGQIKWLIILGFLFGLDFSVHRTNLLLAPTVALIILLFLPQIRKKVMTWLAPFIGLGVGLLVHLSIIPMAMANPFLNANDPSNLGRFIDYVSLKQYGGNWLLNLWPRKADFWNYQVTDYLSDFNSIFFVIDGPIPYIGAIPLLLGIGGLIVISIRSIRLGILLLALYFFSSFVAVFYFNIPENFFRSMDRHYLPSFVIFSLFAGVGAYSLFNWVVGKGKRYGSLLILFMLIVPINLLFNNYVQIDSSNRNACVTYATDYMESLEPNAILFTGGDTDTYPLWYLQQVEKLRPDIEILNLHLLNTTWFVNNLLQRERDFPIDLGEDGPDKIKITAWSDSTINLEVEPVSYNTQLPDSVNWPDSLDLFVPPIFSDKYLYARDIFLIEMLKENKWSRPIYFSSSLSSSQIQYLEPYMRYEGFAVQLLPLPSEQTGNVPLEYNLMERYNYEMFADEAITIELPTTWAYTNLAIGFIRLAMDYYQAGNIDKAREIIDTLHEKIPVQRLKPRESVLSMIENVTSAIREDVDSSIEEDE